MQQTVSDVNAANRFGRECLMHVSWTRMHGEKIAPLIYLIFFNVDDNEKIGTCGVPDSSRLKFRYSHISTCNKSQAYGLFSQSGLEVIRL